MNKELIWLALAAIAFITIAGLLFINWLCNRYNTNESDTNEQSN